ncbi:hypothetical protein BU16DRAFT_554409 [Lophium mytilinum]|uniref:MYND-type domain-containing protein n=1 Tax=Lophium mytilinum TaxID=390894 RepID=A0A6A6RF19_9PEZI|nr:hypothetical protein BU16DRAFT_554409 [Lophium mytilinum]
MQAAHINLLSFFYPIGNTPAAFLTQSIPPEQSVDVLLLGCGDVRSILFTAYMNQNNDHQTLDFTCCDIEAAIIARNVLLFTMISEDDVGVRDETLWNIYYHFYLDDESLASLLFQSQKLLAAASTLDHWHDSKYGRFLKFCDANTISGVKAIWNKWADSDGNAKTKAHHRKRFETELSLATDLDMGTGPNVTAVRSAGPLSIQAVREVSQVHADFWRFGVTTTDSKRITASTHPNPTFSSTASDNATIHYGTNPITGFHLATAYAPLTNDSPLRPMNDGIPQTGIVVQSAKTEFYSWVTAFQISIKKKLCFRFFAGDAMAFCHTLHRDDNNNWYHDMWHSKPIILDPVSYGAHGTAPVTFDVVDTSNLADHVGAVNLLVAAVPILSKSPCSTLYVETSLRHQETTEETVNALLCGNFQTIAFLFGVLPVEYWTNVSELGTTIDHTVDSFSSITKMQSGSARQLRSKMALKHCPTSDFTRAWHDHRMHVDPLELSRLLCNTYLAMFRNEDHAAMMASLISQKSINYTLQNSSKVQHNRGSFALLLRFLRERIETDWSNMMNKLIQKISEDQTLMFGRNYLQELFVYLYVFGVHHNTTYLPNPRMHQTAGVPIGPCLWKDVPPVVCITLKVPCSKLGVFTSLSKRELSTPPVRCTLNSLDRLTNSFSALNMSFGTMSSSGSRDDDDFRLRITEDDRGWSGKEPVLVSFLAPTWFVVRDFHKTLVSFGVVSTPLSTPTFVRALGDRLNVYQTTLGDKDHVFVTKHAPNLSGLPSLPNLGQSVASASSFRTTAEAVLTKPVPGNSEDPRVVFTATMSAASLSNITAHLDIIFADHKSLLTGGALVQIHQQSSFNINLTIGESPRRYLFRFPIPVLESRCRVRIARKSSYVEVVATALVPSAFAQRPDMVYLMFPEKSNDVLWNVPYTSSDYLPILDVAKKAEMQWLVTHISMMFSANERQMKRENRSAGAFFPVHDDLRTNFKDSLFTMFMNFSVPKGRRLRIFGINQPEDGGLHAIFFIQSLRLDLANATVLLDGAVLVLTDNVCENIRPFIAALSADANFRNIDVNADELKLWKHAIPAFAERCRSWKHLSTCEYKTQQRIPSSYAHGKQVICSCGNGKLPSSFIQGVPKWDMVKDYAVRVAISPVFPVPYVEALAGMDSTSRELSKVNVEACAFCRKTTDEIGTTLMRCGRCQNMKYCSKPCQKADWKRHKKICKPKTWVT